MPRRLPGQSIRDQKERLTDNRLVPFYCTTVFAWVLYGWEEHHRRTQSPPHPTLLLCIAVAITGLTAIVFLRLFDSFRRLNRGERGEIEVADALEDLRAIGYKPVHDIVGKGFNVDHVLVGPAGVFAVETKFRSGSGEITFRNGEGLFVDGRPEEKDCLRQARGNARHVNRIIQETCDRYEWVTPLVVFVGDWKVREIWRETDARVLTTRKLRRYFENQQPMLKRNEIELIASHLERSAKS